MMPDVDADTNVPKSHLYKHNSPLLKVVLVTTTGFAAIKQISNRNSNQPGEAKDPDYIYLFNGIYKAFASLDSQHIPLKKFTAPRTAQSSLMILGPI